MALEVFPFALSQPLSELPRYFAQGSESDGGGAQFRYGRALGSRLTWRTAAVVFPNASGLSFRDLDAFGLRHFGGVLPFLVRPTKPVYREVVHEALGTATGAAGQQLPLESRYIDRSPPAWLYADTWLVEVETAPGTWTPQTETTDYTLEGNSLELGATPYIETTASFAAGEVRVTYLRLVPVRFGLHGFDGNAVWVPGAVQDAERVTIALTEIRVFAHRVVAAT